jgi:hypothetical protein
VELKVSVANQRQAAKLPIGKNDAVWLTWAPDAGVILEC